MSTDRPQVRRCAVYTRKSSEEGLEQDFNSLQAQREACEAYITSQRHEGWRLVSTAYDDGGLSGGTMQRPALQRLLADIASGGIDVIVVYKVDRLTRSLADFAKMVEVFDAHGVSFVAVTQQFNTTTSMGRLTLNVLLSFAQFEREVTGERIRDKIAASKKKGMWMGGPVPLGYRVEDKKLIVIQDEAATIRLIYARYLECSGVRELAAELKKAGVRSKDRADKPATVLCKGALYALLANPLYVGQVSHKDQTYPGQHEAIVSLDLWAAVQKKLGERAVRSGIARKTTPSRLLGKIFDPSGKALTPSHAVKKGQRYRYYVSRPGDNDDAGCGWRLPAAEIEKQVERIAVEMVNDRPQVVTAAIAAGVQEQELPRFLSNLDRSAPCLDWVHEVHLQAGAIRVVLGVPNEKPIRIEKTVALQMRRRGVEQRLVVSAGVPIAARPDQSLVKAIGRAMKWWEMLKSGEARSARAIAKAEGVTGRYVTLLLPLAMMAPTVVKAIVEGKHPPELTTKDLLYRVQLPDEWREQKRVLNFS